MLHPASLCGHPGGLAGRPSGTGRRRGQPASYATKYRTKKVATTPKKFKNRTCVASHTKQLRCAGTPALSRAASPGALGGKANPRTVAPSTPRWQTQNRQLCDPNFQPALRCSENKTAPARGHTHALPCGLPLGPSVTTPTREPP